MDFKKIFAIRKADFIYNSVSAKSTTLIIVLKLMCFFMFASLFLMGYNDFGFIMFFPLGEVCFTIIFWILLKKFPNARIVAMMFYSHSMSLLMACLGTHFLGWDSGFYLYLIMTIGLNYVHIFKSSHVNVTMSIIEFACLITLLLVYKDKPATLDVNYKEITTLLYIFNFIFIFFALLYYASLTKISHKITIGTLQEKQEQIKQRARRDFLTGLLNRRAGQEHLQYLFKKLEFKKKQAIAFCMGDLDNFKSINDKYGHNVGDKILKECAMILKNSLTSVDDVCIRWGGEEFLVVLSDITFDKAYLQIEEMRQNIQKNKIDINDETINVTISFGFVYLDKPHPIDEIIEKADILMYRAKTSGKNKTIYGML